MKKFVTLCAVLTLASSITLSVCGCKGGKSGGGDSKGDGGATGSTVTGPRYVYSEKISSMTAVFTLQFTGGAINASGAGVAYREDFTTSTMAFIPGHKFQCAFAYAVSGDTVTITWPDEIINLPESEHVANTPNGNAWAVAWQYTMNMTGTMSGLAPCPLTKTGNNLTATFTQYGAEKTNVWEYKQ